MSTLLPFFPLLFSFTLKQILHADAVKQSYADSNNMFFIAHTVFSLHSQRK